MRQGGCKLLAPGHASRKGGDMGIGQQQPKRCPVQRGFVSLKGSSNYRDEGVDESSIPCFHLRLLLQGPNLGLRDVLQGAGRFSLMESEGFFGGGTFPLSFKVYLWSQLSLRLTTKLQNCF